jgi:hypothetical protein
MMCVMISHIFKAPVTSCVGNLGMEFAKFLVVPSLDDNCMKLFRNNQK